MPKLTHGPLVGATTDKNTVIWLRADGEGTAEIRISESQDPSDDEKVHTRMANLAEADDYTAALSFNGLDPDTTYHYSVRLDDQPVTSAESCGKTTFRTFPQPDQPADTFTFAFGSCFIPEVHGDAIFKNLLREDGQLDPRFFLMIGDNVYVDEHLKFRNSKGYPPVESLQELYREAYRESWKHVNFRQALSQTPSYMIFDDHEFWNNWNNESVHQHDQEGFLAARRAYDEYQDSHNPDFNVRHRTTGDPDYYYTFSYGQDIGFFVLDCRVKRNPDAIPYRSILGDKQRQALYNWLKDNNTTYRVKFIVSSVPISFIALPHSMVNLLHGTLGDQWLGYPDERLELFKFIQHEQIEGVHFLSGDIHLGQALIIEPKEKNDGPTVYSFTSSPLANNFHLLSKEMPGWFSSGLSFIAGLIIGILALQIVSDAPPLWSSIAAGLAGGFIARWLWRKYRENRSGKIKKKSGIVEEALYHFLRSLTHRFYMRKLMGVAADNIKGGGVHYVPDNLFDAVHDYNMGFLTVDRNAEGTITVQFKLMDCKGKLHKGAEESHTI